MNAPDKLLMIDDWIRISTDPGIGVLIKGLRCKIDELLASKFLNPKSNMQNNEGVKLIDELIVSDGNGV